MNTPKCNDVQADRLLKDIAALEKRFRAALDDPRRIDRVRGFSGTNNPYDDFAPKLARLFDRVRAAFDADQVGLACQGYAALFAVLALRDAYGFAVTRPESLVVSEECLRYLRAVCETASGPQRATRLVETMRHLNRSLWEAPRLSIQAVLEVRPITRQAQDTLLDGLIAALGKDDQRDADRWLREAVRLRRGEAGLVELARADSPRRPRAWLDWLEIVAAKGEPAGLLAAAKESLQNIPEGLELRAVAADHLHRAAEALGDHETMVAARWEAFRAEPFPTRLLDLRDVLSSLDERRRWMRRAAERSWDESAGLIPGPWCCSQGGASVGPFLEDGDVFASGATRGTVACARLLAGDWRRAFNAARENGSNDWLGGNDERLLVLPAVMAWLAGWPDQPLPIHLETLLEAGLALLDAPEDPGPSVSRRFKTALAEAMTGWKATAKVRKSGLLDSCIDLALEAVKAILAKGSPTAARQAALWAAAAAQVIDREQSTTAANAFLDNLA